MEINIKNVLKKIFVIFSFLLLSILTDIFIFNYKQFTISKNEKGLHFIKNYEINDIENNKKSIDIKLEKNYIHKLRIQYDTLSDVPITIQYLELDYYNKNQKSEQSDIFDNEVQELISNFDNTVSEIHIIYDNQYSIKINNIMIDNRFQLNGFRILFIFSCFVLIYLFYLFYKEGFKTEKIYKYYFIISMIIGTTSIILQPSATYYSWDDQIHFKNVYEMKAGNLQWDIGEFSMIDATPLGRDSINSIEEQIQQFKYYDLKQQSTYQSIGGRFISYNKIAYIPSAIGYHFCDKIGLPFVVCFKFGKIINLFAFAMIMAYAIKISKVGKRLLSVIGLLPSVMFLACQYSYDPAVISGITLALVILINWFIDRNCKVNFKSMLLFIVSILYGCFPKAIYIPLILLFLFIPQSRFQDKKQCRILKGGIFIICLFILYTFISPANLSSTNGDLRGGNTSVSSQIKLIFSYPIGYIRILKDTMFDSFFSMMLGRGSLGGYAYLGDISYNCYYLILLTLLFVGLTDTNEKQLKLHQKILIIVVILGIITLIWTALYLSFTPVGFTTINGVQPRYFIPFIFPFLMCMQSSKIKNKICEKKYNTIVLLIMSLVLLISIYQLVLRIFCF